MCIQLQDVITPFHLLSTSEQMDIVLVIRHNKYVLKPAMKKRVKKAATKAVKKTNTKVQSLLNALSPAEQLALLKELEDGI